MTANDRPTMTRRSPDIYELADTVEDWAEARSDSALLRAIALLADQNFESTRLLGVEIVGLRKDLRQIIKRIDRRGR